jgi:hypothetical protein
MSDLRQARVRRTVYWLRWLAALALAWLVLVLPDRPGSFRLEFFHVLPAELPFIFALLIVAPPRWRRSVQVIVAGALGLLLALKLADIAMFATLDRAFNPVLDLGLVVYGVDLLARAFGGAGAVVLLTLFAAALAGAAAALTWVFGMPATSGMKRISSSRRRRAAAGLAGVGMLGITLNLVAGDRVVSSWSSRFVAGHAAAYAAGIVDLDRFRAEAGNDRFRDVPADHLLARIAGVDVLLVFVESYGRSVVDPQSADDDVRAALDEFGRAVAGAGFTARTGWLTSPVRGGQSWLAHATLLSGLWVANQRRFDSLTVSDRATLVHDFARAGWHTVAVMPAITFDWPPASFYGYEQFYGARDLGYRGAPFNWVTMPDQYTLSVVADRVLDKGAKPVMAEIALISSHAPWTPIPPLLPWDEIGDGAVFASYADLGDPPDVVWRDPDRVRVQYRKTIAYVLRTLAGFVARHGRSDMLLIVVGDHQPVPFVSGDPRSHDVPAHIISGDPARLAEIEDWGWTDGVVPVVATPVWRMDAFRERLLEAFTPALPFSAEANVPG